MPFSGQLIGLSGEGRLPGLPSKGGTMKTYTVDGIYEATFGQMVDTFIDVNGREPNIGELDEMSGQARRYAKEFIENYADWQHDRDRDDRA